MKGGECFCSFFAEAVDGAQRLATANLTQALFERVRADDIRRQDADRNLEVASAKGLIYECFLFGSVACGERFVIDVVATDEIRIPVARCRRPDEETIEIGWDIALVQQILRYTVIGSWDV